MSEDSVSKKLFTCNGKSGTYELIGIAKPEYPRSIPDYFVELGLSIGAGHSRHEKFTIHQGPGDLLVYEWKVNFNGVDYNARLFGISRTSRVVYKDTTTGQLFHREQADFDDRMLPVAE